MYIKQCLVFQATGKAKEELEKIRQKQAAGGFQTILPVYIKQCLVFQATGKAKEELEKIK